MMNMAFFLDDKKYKSLSLHDRMISDIVGYKANQMFYDAVIDILVKEEEKDDSRLRDFVNDRNTSIHDYVMMKRLYESEFGTLSGSKEIDSFAKSIADHALEAFGWVKTKRECRA